MKPTARAFLLRWHRRIGLLAILFIIVVSVTGIALNHTKEFGLATVVHQPWLLSLYGIDEPAMSMARVGQARIVHDGVDRLYRETLDLGQCGDFFAGAVPAGDGWMAACGESLWVFDGQNRLLERIGVEHGLPGPVESIGLAEGDRIALSIHGEYRLLDMKHLVFSPVTGHDAIAWSSVQVLQRGSPQLPDIPAGSTLTLEQVILDLHSGRLFGRLTVLLMDLSAVAMLLLGISGLVVWGSRRKNR